MYCFLIYYQTIHCRPTHKNRLSTLLTIYMYVILHKMGAVKLPLHFMSPFHCSKAMICSVNLTQ